MLASPRVCFPPIVTAQDSAEIQWSDPAARLKHFVDFVDFVRLGFQSLPDNGVVPPQILFLRTRAAPAPSYMQRINALTMLCCC